MPKVCEFLGISIYFYYNDHAPPHFNARYAGDDAVFDIERLNSWKASRVRASVAW
jgi:hypothetical protein